MTGFSYTPGTVGAKVEPGTTSGADPLRFREVSDADSIEAQRLYRVALTWKPPTGHASWCGMQNPPQWRHHASGDTPMAREVCNCAKSALSRSLRKLTGEEPKPKRAPGRVTVATYNGREYRIPELWIAGYCATKPDGRSYSVADAVAWWAYQQELEEAAAAA